MTLPVSSQELDRLSVRGKDIVYVGDDAGAAEFIGPETSAA